MPDVVYDRSQQAALDELTQFSKSKVIHDKAPEVASKAKQLTDRLSGAKLDEATLATSLQTLEAARTDAHTRSARYLFNQFRGMPLNHGAFTFREIRGKIEGHLSAIPAGAELLDETKKLDAASITALFDETLERASFASAQNRFLHYLKLTERADTGIYDSYHREILGLLRDAKRQVTDLRKPKDAKSTAADGDFITEGDFEKPRRDAHSRAGKESLQNLGTTGRELDAKKIDITARAIETHFTVSGEMDGEKAAQIERAKESAHKAAMNEGLSRLARMQVGTSSRIFNSLAKRTREHAELTHDPKCVSEARRWTGEHSSRIKKGHWSISASWEVAVPSPESLKAKPYRPPQRPEPVPIPRIDRDREELDMAPPGKGKGQTVSDMIKGQKRKP